TAPPAPAALGVRDASWTPPFPDHIAAMIEVGESGSRLPRLIGAAALRDFSLQRVFTRDLVAAFRDGYLTVLDLQAPLEARGIVLGPPVDPGQSLIERVEEARNLAANLVAIDSPEFALAETSDQAVGQYV